jgi:hypothetical protein
MCGFRFLVAMSTASAAYSLAQLLLISRRVVKRDPIVPSRRHAWLFFAGDQVCQLLPSWTIYCVRSSPAIPRTENIMSTIYSFIYFCFL